MPTRVFVYSILGVSGSASLGSGVVHLGTVSFRDCLLNGLSVRMLLPERLSLLRGEMPPALLAMKEEEEEAGVEALIQ